MKKYCESIPEKFEYFYYTGSNKEELLKFFPETSFVIIDNVVYSSWGMEIVVYLREDSYYVNISNEILCFSDEEFNKKFKKI